MTTLKALLANAKKDYDLTEPADQESLYALTTAMLEQSEQTLDALQRVSRQADTPLEFKLAAKLVDSRQYALSLKQPLNIGVVFAMWGEQNRLISKSDTNPNGEDALRTKITQLDWITSDTPIDWTIYAVDDGCPHGSGKIAREISKTHPLGKKVKVLFFK